MFEVTGRWKGSGKETLIGRKAGAIEELGGNSNGLPRFMEDSIGSRYDRDEREEY